MPLIREVQELLDCNSLHLFDAEWIVRLKPESQLAAANKCIHGEILTVQSDWGVEDNRYSRRLDQRNPKNRPIQPEGS